MNAPSLLELQRRMQSSVIAQGETVDIETEIAAPCGIAAAQRIGVYVDAYRLRLLEILAEDYRALARWLGEDEFTRIGTAYIAAHPSDTRSVRWFGRHFGTFLETHAADQLLLAELAHFEWAQGIAFDAADADPAGIARMAAIAAERWPRLRFTFHPCVQLLDLGQEVPAFFQALITDGPRPATLPIDSPPATWLIWRHDLTVNWRKLENEEAGALSAVRQDADFARFCEILSESAPHDEATAPMQAAAMLKRWLNDGLITDIRGTL